MTLIKLEKTAEANKQHRRERNVTTKNVIYKLRKHFSVSWFLILEAKSRWTKENGKSTSWYETSLNIFLMKFCVSIKICRDSIDRNSNAKRHDCRQTSTSQILWLLLVTHQNTLQRRWIEDNWIWHAHVDGKCKNDENFDGFTFNFPRDWCFPSITKAIKRFFPEGGREKKGEKKIHVNTFDVKFYLSPSWVFFSGIYPSFD